MGLLLELAEAFTVLGVFLSAGSGLYDFLKKRQRNASGLTIQETNAHVLIQMPDGKSVRFDMAADEAKRLAQR